MGEVLLERYRIGRPLGSGGMSTVYEATDLRTEKRVAVKLLKAEGPDADALRGWFRRELKSLSLLDHGAILRLLDHGEDRSGTPFLVTELLSGVDLETFVANNGPLADAPLVAVLARVLAGLAAAHAQGIVHRDIKPQNLFLCDDGRVVILDFGIARGTEMQDSKTMAKSFDTSVAGTAHFLSPEQLQGVVLSPRSDLFSLGSTAFYLATGALPYPGKTALDIYQKLLTNDRPLISRAAPRLAADTAALIERLMAFDPAGRPADAQVASRECNELLAARAGAERELARLASRPAGDGTQLSAPTSPTRKRRVLWPYALGAALMIAGVLLWPKKPEAPPVSEPVAQLPLPPPALPNAPLPPPTTTAVPEPPPPAEEPKRAPKKLADGTLVCELRQWAEIVIDGKNLGRKQLQLRTTLSAGDHTLVFNNSALGSLTRHVHIKPGAEQSLVIDFKAPQ